MSCIDICYQTLLWSKLIPYSHLKHSAFKLLSSCTGVAVNEFFPKFVKRIKPVLPLLGVALTTLLCATPCAQVAPILRHVSSSSPLYNIHYANSPQPLPGTSGRRPPPGGEEIESSCAFRWSESTSWAPQIAVRFLKAWWDWEVLWRASLTADRKGSTLHWRWAYYMQQLSRWDTSSAKAWALMRRLAERCQLRQVFCHLHEDFYPQHLVNLQKQR